MFSNEDRPARDGGSRASTHKLCGAAQSAGAGGDAHGGGAAASHTDDGPTAGAGMRQGARPSAAASSTADEGPVAGRQSAEECLLYALLQAQASDAAVSASRRRAMAQINSSAAMLAACAVTLAQQPTQLGNAGVALSALAALQQGIQDVATMVNNYRKLSSDLMHSLHWTAMLIAPEAPEIKQVAQVPETAVTADDEPDWLTQAALLLAADADASAAPTATLSAPAPLGGRHTRRRRYYAAIRLQAGARATIARRRAASLRATDRSAAHSVLTAAAHSCAMVQQISARAAAAEGAAEARAAEARAATEASAAETKEAQAREAAAAGTEEEGLGDHWAAVAEAQRRLAAQLQVDPLSMRSQIEYNLAATRARWAAERAVEAGRTALVARATEPPIATDAPT